MKYLIAISMVLLLFACAGEDKVPAQQTMDDTASPVESSQDNPAGTPRSLYLQLVDGLHVTGEQVDVDIETYRLEVTGDVKSPLALSFQEIKDLGAVTKYIELNCPGFFTDRGDWTGVPVHTVLKLAEPYDTVSEVEFISLDGGYIKKLPLEELMEDRFLLAYQFEGNEFPPIHGYPLRLAADGEVGNVWVKWLGEIRLISR